MKRNPRDMGDVKRHFDNLTLISYIYGTQDYIDSRFYQLENAIMETWFRFGFLKTVIVACCETSALIDFCSRFNDWVNLEICDTLKGGDLYAYSRDCIMNLHKRFSTPYMIFIHPDGFPLRSGLEEFIGKYDYIGAPWRKGKDDWLGRLLLSQRNFVGNGGFSLRSHEICEAAAYWYSRGFKCIPNIFLMYEDYFFTRVLTKYVTSYNTCFKFAPPETAARFAMETIECAPSEIPLGFHSAVAFERLTSSIMPGLEG